MIKPKWTAGPWRLGDDETGKPLTVWGAEEGVCVTYVFDDRMGDDTPPMRQAKANARLIAAAPDLYAAVVALLPKGWRVDDTMDHIPGVKLARGALAKARGAAP